MRSDKSQSTPGSQRQKIIAGGIVIVLIIIIWQVIGVFKGGSKAPPPQQVASATPGAPGANAPNPMQATPKPAQIVNVQPPTSPREIELMQLQQETQAKYIAALNELQMLKVSREIAETNQAIMTARLATVTAEKGIVNLLVTQQPVSTAEYARGLVNPGAPQQRPQQAAAAPILPEVNYSVISVSLLQYRWGAVLGYQGSLYNVHVGDILPPDGSTVVSISKTGVVLERQGVKKKISLVPVI